MTQVRKAGLILTALLLALCLGVGLASCGSKETTPTYGYGEEGTYYSDTSDGEYLLTLRSGTFVLSLEDGTGTSGTYEYSEGTLYMTYYGDEEATECSYSEGVIRLTWSGQTVTFLRREYYTVTFSDGSSTITTQSVLNGRAAQDPGDAEKEGYVFLGWYADSSFTTRYEFNTSITQNTTIYARFVKIEGTTEYKVTYDFGNGETYTEETLNGKIYDLPEAEMTGYTFIGWWVSATNDASELTYRYEGETLCEDTTLFAVYASGSYIGASIKDGTLYWENSPASQMTVTVTDEGGAVYSYDTQTTSQSFSIAALSATGTYFVTVSCGGVTETLTYVSNGLSRVSGFTVISGTILMYGAVENAERYYITIECGTEGHSHEMIDNGSSLYYDFSSCEMPAEGITFTVYAEANGYVTSVSSPFNYFLGLDMATVTVENGEVTWERVALAQEYEVYIDGELVATTSDTSWSLSGYGTGTYEIEVRPVTSGYYSEKSETITFTKTTLASPEITGIEDYTVTWTPVEGATGYIVSINGTETTIGAGDMTSLILSDDNYTEGLDSYEISVKALAEDSANDSPYGETITVTGTSVGSAVSYENGTVTWQYSLSATEYRITVNDGDETIVTGTNNSPVTLTKSGNNEITIYFVNDEGDIYGTASVTVYAYAIVFDARGGTAYIDGEAVDMIYVAKGDTVSLPDVIYTSGQADFGGWYTLPDLTADPDADSYAGDGVAFDDGTVFNGNSTIVLYAFWLNPRINVRLETGDGMLVDADGNLIDETQIALNSGSFTIPVPTIDDAAYAFIGWYSGANGTGTRYTDADGNAVRSFTSTSSITLYAFWGKVIEFSVTTYNGETVLAAAKGSDIDYVTEISIPATYTLNGVEYDVGVLNSNSFGSCGNLKIVNVPDTIRYIQISNNGYDSGTGAFAATGLAAVNVYVTGDEPSTTKEIAYYSDDGVLYCKNSITGDVELVYYPHSRTATDYTVPETVINEFEYELDENLNMVQVVNTVRGIGTQVFKDNTRIISIILPGTITNIDSKAFYGCTSLEKVTYVISVSSNGATAAASLTIGTYAFQNCSSLTEVTLPAFMDEFNVNIFTSCSALENINISGSNGNYADVDGMLCNAGKNEITYCPKGRKGTVTIPSGINSIGDSAFNGCTALEAVIIPGYVSYIGASAFNGCTALTDIRFTGDDYSSKLTISSKAFYGCSALTSLYLPSNLMTLEANAFGNCKALTYVYYDSWVGATADDLDFAAGVFQTTSGTSYIVTLEFGPNVPMLDINTIFGGTSLASVIIDSANTNYYSEAGVVFSYDRETLIYYPVAMVGPYEVPSTVKYIGDVVFQSRTYLTSITIPSSVVYIGSNAFKGCTSLTTVTFRNEEGDPLVLADNVFNGCSKLTTVSLPDRLTEIGDNAFYNCKLLTVIEIPKNVVKMGAYDDDGNLTSMTLFDNCSELYAIVVDAENTMYASIDGILYAKESGELVTLLYCPIKCTGNNGTVTIPNTVTCIWTKAFYNNTGIRFIYPEEAEDGVERTLEIQASAFQNAKGLIEIELPYGIKTIAANTFSGCTLLTHIDIPNSVTSIESGAFSGCTSLSDISFYGEGEEVLRIEDGTASSSGTGAFSGLTKLTSVTLPERTTYIGIAAFRGCAGLKEINIPASVTEIADYAFYGCSSLKNLDMPYETIETVDEETGETVTKEVGTGNLEKIGDYTFYKAGMEVVNHLPETLTSIGKDAFSYSALVSITIPASLEYLGSAAAGSSTSGLSGVFSYATNLTYVTFEPGCKIKAIADSNFDGTNIAEIEIPAQVEVIGDSAFYYCHNLEKVTFAPDSHCVSFGTNCFYICSNLRYFAFPDLAAEVMDDPDFNGITLGAGMFNGCGAIEYMYISAGVYDIIHTRNTSAGIFSSTTTTKTAENVVFEISPDNEYLWQDEENRIIYSVALDDDGNKTKGTVLYLAYGEIKGEFDVPYGVTEISQNAFKYQTSITKITFPSTLTTLGASAFAYCSAVREIVFADGSNVTSTGQYLFRGCSSLVSVDFGKGSTFANFGSTYTFAECTSLKSIELPDGMTSLPNYTFDECTSLEYVGFNNVTSIGNYCFLSCESLKTIDLTGITSLGTYAFRYCTSLENVIFDERLTSTGNYDFDGCTALVSIDLSYVTSIGTYCFRDCTSLENVIFSENLKTIGNYAFDGCSSLVSIAIPETVTSLGTYVFRNCTSLESVTLPSTITSLGNYSFYGCSSLKNIDLTHITSIGNYAFYDCEALESVTFYSGTIGSYCFEYCYALKTIGDAEGVIDLRGVTSIDAYAFAYSGVEDLILGNLSGTSKSGTDIFYYCESLTSVTFTDVITLNKAAFAYCTALESLSLSSDVTITAGSGTGAATYGAFAYCTALKTLNLGDLTSIPDYTFYGCSSLDTIAGNLGTLKEGMADFMGVNTIGAQAFRACESLKAVNLSDATSVGNYAFYNCYDLRTVVIGDGLTSLGTYVFYGCTSLRDIDLNNVTTLGNYDFVGCTSLDYIDLSGVTSIGSYCFQNCSGLVTISLNESVTSLGNYTFDGCTSLVEIDISNVTSLGTYVFRNCSSLTTVTLNEKITEIGTYTFYGCEKLSEIFLPDGLTTLGNYAFAYCYSLTEITIPGKVGSIGNYVFAGSGIQTVTVDAGNAVYKSLEGALYTSEDVLVYYPSGRTEEEAAVLPDGVTIGSYSFSYNETTTKVILPSDLKAIDNYAFYAATGLESVVMPEGLTTIGTYAFYQCYSLTDAVIPDGVETIGNYAFYETGLLEVEIPATVVEIGNYAFGGQASTSGSVSAGTLSLSMSYLSPLEKVTFLTDENGDTALTTLGTQVFVATSIESITIPETVSSIGANLCLGCIYLEEATILAAPATLGNYTFFGCESLKTVNLPDDMTTLSSYMFALCTSLETIDLPDSITFLNTYTFVYSGIKEITIPDGVVHISSTEGVKSSSNGESVYTFYGCEDLETVVFNATLESIGAYTFSHCTSLENITYKGYEGEGNAFPETLELLAHYSFEYTGLKEITIPASVNTMYPYVFQYCTSLETVYCEEGLRALGTNLNNYGFRGCTSLSYIYIPESMGYLGSYLFQDCTNLDHIILSDRIYVDGNVFNGWTSSQKIYVPFNEYRSTGPWSSNWDNNSEAAVYYYLEKPAFNTYLADTGANYWYYDDDGDTELDGRMITEWRYEDVASDEVEFALDSYGSFVAYHDSEDYIFGMRIYDAASGSMVYRDATDCAKSADGKYRVTLADGSVYDVVLDAATGTATAELYATGYSIGAADSRSYISMAAGDAAEFVSMRLYAGTPGDYISYEIVATEELTGTDDDGASYTYYRVTTDTGDVYYVTLGADGTATVEEVPHEYAEILVENYEGALDGYELSGFTFEIHIYGVFDLTADTVVNVRVILSVKLSVITLYTFDFYYDDFECRTEYGTDASGNTTVTYYVSADSYTFKVTMNDDGTCTAILQ